MLITGEMLREAREAFGVSLSDMARRTYLNKGYLSRVETRHGVAPHHIVKRYEQVLGVDMNRRGFISGLAAGAVLPEAVVDALRRGIDREPAGTRSFQDWMVQLEAYAADAMTLGTSDIQIRIATDLVLLQSQLTEARMWAWRPG